jgi:hypothetical protein
MFGDPENVYEADLNPTPLGRTKLLMDQNPARLAGLLWRLSSEQVMLFHFFFLSLKSCLCLFPFWLRFLFDGQPLSCADPACYPHAYSSVPVDDSKVSEEERGAPNLRRRVQQADPSPGPGARRSKSLLSSGGFFHGLI